MERNGSPLQTGPMQIHVYTAYIVTVWFNLCDSLVSSLFKFVVTILKCRVYYLLYIVSCGEMLRNRHQSCSAKVA